MKKLFTLLLAVLLVLGLAGCSSKSEATTTETESKVITVAASPTPHAEILAHVKDTLAADGWDLQVTEFDDYVLPNSTVVSGEILCNYFQHVPYMDDWNTQNGGDLVSVAKIHYEPLGLYAGTKTSLADIADGDVIAVPNDPTNEYRALRLLEANGIIVLNDGLDSSATVLDIKEYKVNVTIKEFEAAEVARHIDEVACAVINGNYALNAGLGSVDAIVYESQDAASARANIISVKAGNEDNAGVKALIAALQDADVQAWINETYGGAVVAYVE